MDIEVLNVNEQLLHRCPGLLVIIPNEHMFVYQTGTHKKKKDEN
jgi:hypothetical protein